MPVMPGAEGFAHPGGPVAVLLCHGFTGTPAGVRSWGNALAAAGLTVHVPLLPGHGTHWRELNRTRWADWFGCVEHELAALRAAGHTVLVGGLSLGGALALRLAQVHGSDVTGLILVNPALRSTDRRLPLLPLIRLVRASAPGIASDIRKPGAGEISYDRTPRHAVHSMVRGWRAVERDLSQVRQPVLLFRSPDDHVVPPESSRIVLSGISSTDVTEVLCSNSYHVATLDHDAPLIEEGSVAFVHRLTATIGGSR